MFIPFDITPTILAVGFVLFTVLYTLAVKFVERRLTFTQSALLSVAGVAAAFVFFIVYYYLIKIPLGFSKKVDEPMKILAFAPCMLVITGLARNYGIEKTGKYGLGDRATLWVIGLVVLTTLVVGVAEELMGR